MKKLLAENMLRFGVKNLTESQITKIQLLTEGVTDPNAAYVKYLMSIPVIADAVKTGTSSLTKYTGGNNVISSMDNQSLILSLMTPILNYNSNEYILANRASAAEGIADYIGDIKQPSLTKKTFFQLHDNPDNPGKIRSNATFSAESGFSEDQKDAGFGSQTIQEIVDAVNTYNVNVAWNAIADGGNPEGQTYLRIIGDPIPIMGSWKNNDRSQGRETIRAAKPGPITGKFRKGSVPLYMLGEITAPETETQADFNIIIGKDEKGFVDLPLSPEIFVKGKTNLNMAVVNKFIQDVKALGNPSAFKVVASASGNETFNNRTGNAATHNLGTGFPKNHNGKDVYDVTGRQGESGNALLANTRANGFAKALQSAFPNAKIETQAVITPGAENARYMKALSQIQKPDQSGDIMTSMDLKQIVSRKSSKTDRGAGYQLGIGSWYSKFWTGCMNMDQVMTSKDNRNNDAANIDTQTGVDGLDQAARGLTGQ